MMDNLRKESVREKQDMKPYLEILIKWRRNVISKGIMEEREIFPSPRRINNDEEIVVVFEILESTLMVR